MKMPTPAELVGVAERALRDQMLRRGLSQEHAEKSAEMWRDVFEAVACMVVYAGAHTETHHHVHRIVGEIVHVRDASGDSGQTTIPDTEA